MADIGEMLRDARMRARIDISEIEEQTKIRAKYLRALENEEWALLPGPAYVKSFLRTYADRLGLDSKMLVEEYKLRHERPADIELQPIRPGPGRERRTPSAPQIPRWIYGAGVLLLLLAALYALGSGTGNHTNSVPNTTLAPPAKTTASTTPTPVPARRAARVALQILPTAPVWVCLIGPSGNRLINAQILTPGATPRIYRGKSFRVTLGNGSVRLRIDGHTRAVPQVNNAIGYAISRTGRKVLPAAKRPTCA